MSARCPRATKRPAVTMSDEASSGRNGCRRSTSHVDRPEQNPAYRPTHRHTGSDLLQKLREDRCGMEPSWSNFYVAVGGAAAALTGLLFIAVSLRPREIRDSASMVGRARSAFHAFAAVTFVGAARLSGNGVPMDRTRPGRGGNWHCCGLGSVHGKGGASRRTQLPTGDRLPRRTRGRCHRRPRPCGWREFGGTTRRRWPPVPCCCLP